MEMIEMRVDELEGKALGWAVAYSMHELTEDGGKVHFIDNELVLLGGDKHDVEPYAPWENYHQCEPLVRSFEISFTPYENQWDAMTWSTRRNKDPHHALGDTMLLAACRAVIKEKFRSTVSVPLVLVRQKWTVAMLRQRHIRPDLPDNALQHVIDAVQNDDQDGLALANEIESRSYELFGSIALHATAQWTELGKTQTAPVVVIMTDGDIVYSNSRDEDKIKCTEADVFILFEKQHEGEHAHFFAFKAHDYLSLYEPSEEHASAFMNMLRGLLGQEGLDAIEATPL